MSTTLHITIDKVTKQKAQKLAKEMGLDLSTVVKASLKSFVQTEVFHVEKNYEMTPYLEKIITQAKKDQSSGKSSGKSEFGPFKTAKESVKFLRSKSWK